MTRGDVTFGSWLAFWMSLNVQTRVKEDNGTLSAFTMSFWVGPREASVLKATRLHRGP